MMPLRRGLLPQSSGTGYGGSMLLRNVHNYMALIILNDLNQLTALFS